MNALPTTDELRPQSIIPFNFEGDAVRVITIDGSPWFVAKDVATVLGYARTADAVRAHCRESVKYRIPTQGGKQEAALIPERDLYRLILRSKLPTAGRFEEWVVGEVLPTIRKTGGYGAPDYHAILSDPDSLRGLLLTYTEKVIALEATVAEQALKVAALNRIAKSDGSLCITDAAKTLNVRPKDLFFWLRQHGWIYSRPGKSGNIAYQYRIQTGLMEHKVVTVSRTDGTERTVDQVRVTTKGLTKLAMLMSGGQQTGAVS